MDSILTITSEMPWPLNSGGHLRTFHVLKSLATAFDVRLVVPVLSPPLPMGERGPGGEGDDLDHLLSHGIRVIPVSVPPRSKLSEAKRLIAARLHGEPYALYRRHSRSEMFAAIDREIQSQRPNVVYLDHLDSYQYRPQGIPAILDLHNIYSLILNRMADEAKNPLKRLFLRGEAKRLAKIESHACKSGVSLLAVSATEAEHFRGLGCPDVTVAPNGVDCQSFARLPAGREIQPLVILYLGTLSWGPNASAALYLAEKIFPQIRAVRPDAKLLLVGKDPSPEVRTCANQPGVVVTGSVPSIEPYLREATLLAVPLDSGGGTRLKILEAFAAGLPVVSTKIGAEGIDARPGHEIILAEREEMAKVILQAVEKPDQLTEIARNARALAEGVYDWSRIGASIIAKVRSLRSEAAMKM